MAPLPLPPAKGKTSPIPAKAMGQAIKDRKKSDMWVTAPGVRYDLGGYQVYMIQVAMLGSGYSGISVLAHTETFSQDRMNAMTVEAAAVVLEVRVMPRRKRLSENQVPIEDAKKSNMECFRDDTEFFESVMVDRFGFEKVQCGASRADLEPTIKGLSYAG